MSNEQKLKISESVTINHPRAFLGRKHTPQTIEKMRKVHKGKIFSEEHRRKLSVAHLGKKMSESQRMQMSLSRKGKTPLNVLRGDFRGSKSPSWKGGITPEHIKQRNSVEMKRWRIAVFKRDNYTCVLCFKRGCELNADHIKRFADYPELRFELSNGRTLCKPCHIKITFKKV